MHHERRRPLTRRAGCKLCKPWKVNGVRTERLDGEKFSDHRRRRVASASFLQKACVRLNQGSLYPALVRLEQKGWIKGAWRTTENNREARYYIITKAGAREIEAQVDRWQRSTGLVNRLLASDEP